MSNSKKSNTSKGARKSSPKTAPVTHKRSTPSPRPRRNQKGYKPVESTHQPTPPRESGSGLKDN